MAALAPDPGVPARTTHLADGAERLELSRNPYASRYLWASVYRVHDTLIDTGPASCRAAFVRSVREWRIQSVLTTHEHEDHIGNHAALPEGATVYAPPLACRFLDEGTPPFPRYRRLVWGMPEPRPGALPVGDSLRVAERDWRVIQVPGHAVDMVAYLDEAASVVYSGDAYLGLQKTARLEEDVWTGLDSLRRLADLDAAELRPAHGPILTRPRQRLLEAVACYEKLARRAWRFSDDGLTHRAIARALLGPEPFITWFSAGEFSGANLITNLLRRRPD